MVVELLAMSSIGSCLRNLRILKLYATSLLHGAWLLMPRSWFLSFAFVVFCVTGPSSVYSQILRVDYGTKKTSGQIKNGSVTATIEHKRRINSDGVNVVQPVVKVLVGDTAVGSISTQEVGSPNSILQIVELDPSNPYPEVLLSTFTGGAHCCNDTRVLTSDANGNHWSVVKLDLSDGGTNFASDPLSLGRNVIVGKDDRFLYRFSSYASSWSPARIWQLNASRFVDVSHHPEYRPIHRKSLGIMSSWFSQRNQEVPNGFLAAYVANKSLVGELFDGWDRMLLRYDQNGKWGLTVCTAGYDDNGICRAKEIVYDSYPQALRAFLIEAGYLNESGR